MPSCSSRLILSSLAVACLAQAAPRPNIILAMADDMGWGDPGYNSVTVTYANGTPHPDQGWINTPTMDAMAANGLRFDRFYSASAVCSPTRASCLTGRNPFRVGIPFANQGRLGFDETPLSEVLSPEGYACGHFGKWHLGSMTTLRSDSNRGGDASVYSAPWHHGYDFCFATESKVPTCHPYRKANNGLALPTSFSDPNFYGTRYWRMPATWNQTSGEGDAVPVGEVNNAVDGDDSKLIVDQAINFIQDSVGQGQPFFVVLWFHTPHKPIVDPDGVSGVDSSDALKDSIEDMDTALGRLRDELTTLGVRGNTMFWLTSDNGPENGVDSPNETSTVRSLSSGRFLERKRSLHEGGLRVPGILEWPDVITNGMATDFPAVTSDYYPTILDYLQLSVPNQKPIDGISLRPVIDGTATARTSPIGFKIQSDKSWVNDQYKLIDDGSGWELYDLVNIAPSEEVEQTPAATAANIGSKSQAIQDVYNTMLAEYTEWNNTLASDTAYVHASQPTVSLSTALTTVAAPFVVTATFSEAITQLNANEFAVTNGTASGLTGSGKTWNVTISPASDGAVAVQLPAGAVIDVDGNVNATSNELNVTYSNTSAPLVTLSTPVDSVFASFEVTVAFNEDVSGLESTDFDVTNGTASGLAGGPALYSLTVTPAVAGTVSIFLPAGVVQDGESNVNSASNTLEVSFSPPSAPSVILAGPSTAAGAYTVDVSFDEPVVGLADGDFSVTNGIASGVSGSGSTYSILITPVAAGDVTVVLPVDSVIDLDDGLGNTISNTLVTNFSEEVEGAVVSNGDLNKAVGQYGSTRGNSGYYLDTSTGNVLEDQTISSAGGIANADTGVDAGQWVWSTLTRGLAYDGSGGDSGEGGAFVAYSPGDPFNQKPRAVAQFASDGGATVGLQTICMDVFLDDNSAANALLFDVEVYAWNGGEIGPKLSLGGATGNDPTYNHTILGDAVTLLNTQVLASSVADATWEKVTLGSVDLGAGYDYYAWRIGVMGATNGDDFAFDNIIVRPPTYEEWEDASGLVPADQGFDLDPDGDRIPNGVEAWFGTDPGKFSEGLAVAGTAGGVTTFTHPKSVNPPSGLSGSYEWSQDLSAWYEGDGIEGPSGGSTVTIHSTPDGGVATASEVLDHLFLRVVVTEETP